MQLIAHLEGGAVVGAGRREYGRAEVTIDEPTGMFAGFDAGEKTVVWMSHGDHVDQVPPGYVATAHSGTTCAGFRHETRPIHAVQFHSEVHHTARGAEIIENFLFGICHCDADWTPGHFIDLEVAKIRALVGDRQVICGLSGGVDSSVAAALVHKAIGDQLTCIFVDTGLLRLHEREQVERTMGMHLGIRLITVRAEERFLSALAGVGEPERKRKIIGEHFIRVFEEASAEAGKDAAFLVQGTLYPDVIESVSAFGGPTATIKTHHNVGGLPDELGFELVEPLRDLFKDEVREIGRELSLPDSLVWRHPFPGPGLAVRCLGDVRKDRLDVLRKADRILQDELGEAGLVRALWQAFCVLLPVRTVGVMGDERTYDEVCAIRAVTSDDAMTADWAQLPDALLRRVSNRIINEVRGINRVVLDISSKPPATIEWE